MSEPVDVRVLDGADLTEGRPGDLLSHLVGVVNAAYAVGEAGLWRPGVLRTDRDVLAAIAARGELTVARFGGAAVGCVRTHDVVDGAVEIGMLAIHPAHQGHGLGAALMDHAEDRARSAGRTAATLELLVPVVGTHPAKERLAAWYSRRGYEVVGTVPVREAHPELVDDLAVACDMLRWCKPL